MEALKGIRILDMTHVQAGPTSSQLLAWMGADVIKLESPVGDATRGQLRDVPNADSLYLTMLNCNKRSIVVNMKSPEGKALKFVHRGSYDNMDNTYEAITNHLDDKKLEAKDTFIEEYMTDPLKTAEDKLVINVYVQLK